MGEVKDRLCARKDKAAMMVSKQHVLHEYLCVWILLVDEAINKRRRQASLKNGCGTLGEHRQLRHHAMRLPSHCGVFVKKLKCWAATKAHRDTHVRDTA